MAKDYFQDITPPASPAPRGSQSTPSSSNPAPRPPAPPLEAREMDRMSENEETPERSIRNINITSGRRTRIDGGPMTREGGAPPPSRAPRGARYMLWGGVALALLILAAILFVALRPTTVSVVPRSHTVLFDETARFTAYPALSAATGTLSFRIETTAFEDSQVVPAEGIERIENRANGAITIYNEYSPQPVKLIKNTRFETPQGLVFRVPAEVMVPGRRGATPGEISVTVIADKAGEVYNVGPDMFKLPGLKSTPDMYAKVYARSTDAMSGGFAGDRPAASPAALQAAQADIRSRFEEKIRAFAGEKTNETTFAFADLARVTFESLPGTAEEGGKVRLNERARVELPVFSAASFAYIVGQSVSANAENGSVMLKPGEGFLALPEAVPPTGPLPSSPLSFTLRGKAQLVWKVDTQELASSLAGRDEVAFQAIVESFPGIEEARARIEPFWTRTFPTDPSAIKIKVQEPQPGA